MAPVRWLNFRINSHSNCVWLYSYYKDIRWIKHKLKINAGWISYETFVLFNNMFAVRPGSLLIGDKIVLELEDLFVIERRKDKTKAFADFSFFVITFLISRNVEVKFGCVFYRGIYAVGTFSDYRKA